MVRIYPLKLQLLITRTILTVSTLIAMLFKLLLTHQTFTCVFQLDTLAVCTRLEFRERLSELHNEAENENILMEPTWLLRPIKDNGALNQHQRHFNKELSKARVVSEHAFGLTEE